MSLLFNYLLSLPSLPRRVLVEVRSQYGNFINSNCDIGHKWAELVIKNKVIEALGLQLYHLTLFSFLLDYLANNQSMGVYLYGELLSSKVIIDSPLQIFHWKCLYFRMEDYGGFLMSSGNC